MKRYKMAVVLLALFATGFFAAKANATIIIEDFEGVKNNQDSYSSQGFLYDPAKGTAGQCYSGICLQEDTQSIVTDVTTDPEGGMFDLYGFYINKNGKVGTGDNLLQLTATNAGGTSDIFIEVLSDITTTFYDVDGDGMADDLLSDFLYLFDEDGNETTSLSFDSDGYFMLFKDDLFHDEFEVKFTSLSSATLRIDCMMLGDGGSATPTTFEAFNGCEPNAVPEPGSLSLLALGLFGLTGITALRKKYDPSI